MRPTSRNWFKLGYEIKIEPVTSGKAGFARVIEVVNENTIVVSQSRREKEGTSLSPHEVIRIFIEKDDMVSCFQGIMTSLKDCEAANLLPGTDETFYCIKNLFFKHRHRKRMHPRPRVKLAADVAAVSGLFARKSWRAKVINISPGGMSLIVNQQPPSLETEVSISIFLAGRKIKIKGLVIGINNLDFFNSLTAGEERGFGLNIRITGISDADYPVLVNFTSIHPLQGN